MEKSYQDFKGFAASLEYNLREKGIRAPKLNSNNMFETLMASSDEMFKNLDNESDDLSVEDQLRNVIAFCNELASDIEYYTIDFYVFFNIPDEFKPYDNDGQESDVESVHRPSEIRLNSNSFHFLKNQNGDQIKWKNF